MVIKKSLGAVDKQMELVFFLLTPSLSFVHLNRSDSHFLRQNSLIKALFGQSCIFFCWEKPQFDSPVFAHTTDHCHRTNENPGRTSR